MFQKFAFRSSQSDAAQETAIAVEATTGDKFIYTIAAPCRVTLVGCHITVTLAYDTLTTAAVVSFDRRPTFASDTGRVEIETVTLADATAAGYTLYSTCNTKFLPGEQLVVEAKTQGAGGGSIAGDWLPVIWFEPIDEVPGNCTYMTVSA